MFQKIINQAIFAGINFPIRVAVFLITVTLATGLGLSQLRIDTSFSSLVSASNPDKPVYEQIIEEFGSDDRTIIYIRDKQLWSPEKLAKVEALHQKLEETKFVSQIEDLFTVQNIQGKDGHLEANLLMHESPKEQSLADSTQAKALNNPLIMNNLVSSDGQAMAIIISVTDHEDRQDFDHFVNSALESILKPYQEHFDNVFQLGSPRINAELKNVLLNDLTVLAPLSLIVLVLSIAFFLRSGLTAILPVATSLLSLIWTFGLMGWMGIPVNILTAMLPSLLIVIGSTEDTHIMSGYFQALAKSDGNRADATRLTMRMLGIPLILTILTTAFGFASNIFSELDLIQDFAMASTLAIVVNGIITLLLLPMMLSLIGPEKDARNSDSATNRFSDRLVHVFTAINDRHSNLLLILTLVVCIFFVYQASRLDVSNDPVSYFQSDAQLIQDVNTLHRDLAGMKMFFITLESDRKNAFIEPKNIETLVEIQSFLGKQGVFDKSTSLADYISLMNREFHQGNANYYDIPRQRELIAQYLLLLHRQDLHSVVSHDYRKANIIVRHNISDSATLNSYIRELNDAVTRIAGRQMRVTVSGENLMINAATEHLIFGQVKSLGVLLVVIFLLMSALFTSFKAGLVALIPSLIPIIMMFGIMGLLDIPLNPGTAMVAVIAIGIAIDGTIHLFTNYNDLCRQAKNNLSAIRATIRHEATPMFATGIALAFGFGVLLFSDFSLIAQFGALSAATMLLALYANLLVAPIIIARIRLVGLYQILSMDVEKEVLEMSPLFRDMTLYQIRKAILLSEMHQFEPGELLMQQDSVGRSMYLILSGEVEAIRHAKNKKQRIASMKAGEVFGEIGYIREAKRTADIRAISKVKVICFDFEGLKKDLKFFPHIIAKLNFNISYILGERLEEVRTRLDEMNERTVKEPKGNDIRE